MNNILKSDSCNEKLTEFLQHQNMSSDRCTMSAEAKQVLRFMQANGSKSRNEIQSTLGYDPETMDKVHYELSSRGLAASRWDDHRDDAVLILLPPASSTTVIAEFRMIECYMTDDYSGGPAEWGEQGEIIQFRFSKTLRPDRIQAHEIHYSSIGRGRSKRTESLERFKQLVDKYGEISDKGGFEIEVIYPKSHMTLNRITKPFPEDLYERVKVQLGRKKFVYKQLGDQ